jgi:thymidylate synthase
MNNIDRQYKELLEHILHFGVEKKDRTGTGTKSIFGWQIRHNMKEGFPLLTTKKMAWKTMVTELLWFLRGDTNIKYLVDNGCHIWDGDAYKNFTNEGGELTKEEFINKIKTDERWEKSWGDLGPIYGKQWRSWDYEDYSYTNDDVYPKTKTIDQIANLISELKTNPDSRRMMVTAWNVSELDQMVLPPCHYGFQIYTRELSLEERIKEHEKRGYTKNIDPLEFVPNRSISLMWNQRSVDTLLGLPFNIASYGLLLEIIAKEVNMVPEDLIGNLGDVHLYSNHIEQAKEQITRTPYELPKLNIKIHFNNEPSFVPEYWLVDDFVIENYQSHPAIKAPLSN